MNKLVLAAGVVVLAGAGFTGATWYAGKKIDQQITQMDEMLKDYPIVKTVKRDLQPGFWTSTEQVTYRIGCGDAGADNPLQGMQTEITLNNVIRHNPLALGVDTTIVFDEAVRTSLNKVFKGQEPLLISTRIALNGDLKTSVSSPAFTLDDAEGKAQWQGIDATFKYDKTLSFIKTDLKMPGGSFKSAAGDAEFKLGELSYSGDRVRNSDGLYLGKESLQLAGLSLLNNAPDLVLGKVSLSSETSQNQGLVRMLGKGEMQGIKIGKQDLGVLSLDYDLGNLDAKSLASFNKLSTSNGILQCSFNPMENMAALQTLFVEMIKKDPSIKQTLKLVSSEGETNLAIDVSTKGITEQDLQSPQTLLPKISASVAGQLPKPLLNRLLREAFEPESQDMMVDLYQSMITELESEGKLVQDGDLIKAKLQLKDGQMNLNGKAVPMEALLGL